MGYYTTYELSVPDPKEAEEFEKMKDVLEVLDTWCPDFGNWLNRLLDGDDTDAKWYDHDKDMKELTRLVPDVTFMLSGKGEEDGDLWRSYYRNGKMATYKAKITIEYDDFDPEDLEGDDDEG